MSRLRIRAAAVVAGVMALGAVVLVGDRTPAPVHPAADTSQFSAGNIISDAVFFNGQTMSSQDVQGFLLLKEASCVPSTIDGAPCLKDYRQDTVTKPADSFCPAAYTGAPQETAATIIAKVALACGISPRVLLVTLQKEQGLVTSSGGSLSWDRYRKAMGYGCPDTGAGCDSAYWWFQNQLYNAAHQFKRYALLPQNYTYRAGQWNNVPWSVNAACGTGPVFIQNQATAGLYNYTPYQPNQAALSAGYGTTTQPCAQYGNRNFWLYFTDWFGSTQYDSAIASMPQGSVDAVTSSYGQVRIGGWAFDPDRPTDPLQVHIYLDGIGQVATTANGLRADVGAAYPGVGANHGYTVVFTAPLGQHTVCAYAINEGAGTVNPQLGCRTIDNEDAGAPLAHLDSLDPAPGGIDLAGWAYDPDTTTAGLTIAVQADGTAIGTLTASGSRPDVGTAYGIDPNHGFSGHLALGKGAHNVCLAALNVGLGTHDGAMGCRTVTVPDPASFNPVGVLEAVSSWGRTASASGWVVDPDVPTTPSTVSVSVDGVATSVTAGDNRPDVATAWPSAGAAHGFAWSGVLAPGSHQICVTAVNQGVGTGNPGLGCRSVTTTAGNPFGNLESVTSSQGTVSVAGWAVDPDAATTPVTVHVYVDGSLVTPVTADQSRPDIAAAFPAAGSAHGLYWSTSSLTPGQHQVCLYMINIGPGTQNPALGCRTLTVDDVRVRYNPVGRLDAVTASAGSVAVSGWAYDPDQPTAAVLVHVYVDGRVTAGTWADQSRPDVGAAIAGIGDHHGYSWSGTLGSGSHQVCTYAINVGLGTTNPLLGCLSVRVP